MNWAAGIALCIGIVMGYLWGLKDGFRQGVHAAVVKFKAMHKHRRAS